MGYLYRSGLAIRNAVLEGCRNATLTATFATAVVGVGACSNSQEPVGGVKAATAASESAERASKAREDALATARVWTPPAVPVGSANLRDNPPGTGAFRPDEDVSCRFKVETVNGLTPKFHCDLASGDTLKVKYGSGNAELHAEVAATRLLSALGFAADRMYVVGSVRCAGCPTFPFGALQCLKKTGIEAGCFPGGIDYDRVITFESAVIERRLEGRKIEAVSDQGWAWFELNKIDPSRGGSSVAEVDALRLMAVILAHWDNKAENQRLLCSPDAERPDGSCANPLAIIQDVGATFGPLKVDLTNWRLFRVWTDAKTCTVSMKTLPYNGATFVDRQISEGGRSLLLGLLEQLTDQQLKDLFENSRMIDYDQITAEARAPEAWVKAFRDKVSQVRDAGPCPAVTAS
ncbi:hypothetical protein BH18ACI5_BH18ACI5_24810 [soil metagenome]